MFNNIAIGNVNDMGNDEKVKNAASLIGLHEVADQLPGKYKTPITKTDGNGVDLSNGEWQKIAIARLMVSPAPLKILDEPTASLDPISESHIYEQFGAIVSQNQDMKSNGIVICISHRLGSTKIADSIIVVSEGKAAEVGTFSELMEMNGIYAKMYTNQAKWYI